MSIVAGMNFIAFMLVIHLEEEDAFWMFATMMSELGLRDLFHGDTTMLKVCVFFPYRAVSLMQMLAIGIDANSKARGSDPITRTVRIYGEALI